MYFQWKEKIKISTEHVYLQTNELEIQRIKKVFPFCGKI